MSIEETGEPANENNPSLGERIIRAIEQSKIAVPNRNKRPSDEKIGFAVKAGIDPVGMTRAQLSNALSRTVSEWQNNPIFQENAREYLAALLPAETPIDVGALSDHEVKEYIRQRHDQLEEEFPRGSSISWEESGKQHFAVIGRYFVGDNNRKYLSFVGKTGSRPVLLLRTAKRLHGHVDPSVVELQSLRTRIQSLVEDYFRKATMPIDFAKAVPKTVMAITNRWKVRKSVPTDQDIIDSIEKLKGKTFGEK